MDPSEVTVIVYQAKGLQSKKKGKHKYNVTFGINNNKARSENEDSPDGTPEWNTEAQIKVDDPMEPLIMKVKDKDDILGQVTLHMHELPTAKPARPKQIPLQPHKKAPNPKGELVFCAWISAYADSVTSMENSEKQQKSSTLKKMKGAVSHSPLFNRKLSLSANTSGDGASPNLASQKAHMSAAGIDGSNESLGSTISGFSTLSQNTKKKKSALKKLKGAFKKSPLLGGSNLPGKNSSQSCMNLSVEQSNMLSVHSMKLDGSQESLASQTSGFSNFSGLSGGNKDKKSKNPFKKLKAKMSSKSALDKSNSQSMHNLAFGPGGMPLPNANMHGSSESLDKLKSSAMGKNFPNKFDLTVPKTLLNKSATSGDEGENNTSACEPNVTPIMGHKRTGSDTPSLHSTGSGQKVGTPEPQHKRRMSYQMRSLRDDPRERPKPESSPKPSPKPVRATSSSGSNTFEAESTSVTSKSPGGRSLCLPKEDVPTTTRSPALGSSKEDIRASKNSINSLTVGKGSFHERSASYSEVTSSENKIESLVVTEQHAGDSAYFTSTPAPPAPEGITSKNVVDENEENKPEISGVSPSEGSIEGGTKITIRGSNLGVDKSDVVWLSICGSNCLSTLEYFSEYKLRVTTKVWNRPGSGKIVIETQSGGKSKSLVDFTFVDYNPQVEEATKETLIEKTESDKKSSKKMVSPSRMAEEYSSKSKKEQKPEQAEQSSVKPDLRDLSAEKRQDPEGMPTAKDDQITDSEKNNVSVMNKDNHNMPSTKQTVSSLQRESNLDKEQTGEQNETQLMEMIKKLKAENQSLKEDNVNMKNYMDRIIDKVIDRCPDVLCVDTPQLSIN